jgi:glycosyltransferase involved in cell wall biosynthesis
MKVAMLIPDNRDEFRRYDKPAPFFGPAPTALLEGLSERPELELHIISCAKRPMSAPEKLAKNIWFHLLHVKQSGWLRSVYSGCVLAIRKKLREIRPDLVHGQGTERYCALAAAFSGFPSVITIHGNMIQLARLLRPTPGSYLWCSAILERFTLPRTSGVFCNSQYTESAVGRHARQTWRVPNAVRTAFFETPLRSSPLEASKPKILNVGTIAAHKRQIELLELAQQLYEAGHSFQLEFIGDANPGNKYAARFLRRVGSAERSGFALYVGLKSLPELIACLDSASALIHVPSGEAFGLVVAEALARNLKFFGATVGGVPDIASGTEGAELFPLEDQKALFAAVANWLREGSPKPKSAAAEMQKRYHPHVIATRHEEIYRDVLGLIRPYAL